MTSGFAEVNGARLWHEEAGAGPALVLLHGHLLDSGQWDSQFPAFAREFRTVRYDARGFGRSDLPDGPFSFTQDLRGLMEFLGIERASLVGNSGGGATIVDLALAQPEMVDALVPVGSSVAGYRFTGEAPPAMVEHRRAMQRGDVERAVEVALEFSTDAGRRPDQVDARAREHTREMLARQAARPDAHAQNDWLEPEAASRLMEISAPTLLIVGDLDNPAVLEIADLMAREVLGARKEVMRDAGHHPNMEHPARFNDLVLTFLRSLPPRGGG